MKKLETVENRVLAVLKEHPEARNDDMKLYLLISKACIYDTYGIADFSFEDVMSNYKAYGIALQQKVKVLAKLYDSGCKTEKDLKALSLQSILKIPDISVSDMTVITELQEQIAKNRLFSYLGGADDEQQSEQSDG